MSQLLQEMPDADGRGTIVAVLDTGCDLAAAGLLKTSDGKPKYVDFLDCTGSGDVDTSTKKTREEDGTIIGLSGRTLRLGSWADGVETFHVGAVRLFDLLPGSVAGRLKRERKAAFEVAQHSAVTQARRALDEVAASDKAGKADAEALLKQLSELMDEYDDAGPLLDVVAYQALDGSCWKAVLTPDTAATDETGKSAADGESASAVDLRGTTPMAPYRVAQQVGDVGFGTALTYCVQIGDGGDRVSVVVDAGSHGTHVAGIVAAHFEDAADRNGVAPGAQILACKIGDSRLGSAETGTGLVRALIAAKERGCELINLSYGEPFWENDVGRVSETFNDATRKWGMTVFTSAGNDGPALSTLGAPGHLSAPITVGAYISPAMMADQYSMLPPKSEADVGSTSYSFSSRGPTPDGQMPTLCAPGGAIAPVPRHTLQGKAQYHGTSMSSPNACGVAAVVLSALRQQGIGPVGPIELRRALETSATQVDISDPFAQGAGLINAPAAVAYAAAHHGKPGQDVEFAVTVPSRANARGLYLRDAAELAGPLTFGVLVKPLFSQAFVRSAAELRELLDLELDLKLQCDVPWVTTPDTMVLTSGLERGGQSFALKIDPAGLAPGAHFTTVKALDATDTARGPLFSLPVTVIVPHATGTPTDSTDILSAEVPSSDGTDGAGVGGDAAPIHLKMELAAGEPVRRFLVAPEVAEWATVRIRTGAMPEGPHSVILHAVPSARGDVPNSMLQVRETAATPLRYPSTAATNEQH